MPTVHQKSLQIRNPLAIINPVSNAVLAESPDLSSDDLKNSFGFSVPSGASLLRRIYYRQTSAQPMFQARLVVNQIQPLPNS